MDSKEVQARLDQVQLVDVREPEEWQAGRIPGAQWIRMNELGDRLDELDPNQPVVTVAGWPPGTTRATRREVRTGTHVLGGDE